MKKLQLLQIVSLAILICGYIGLISNNINLKQENSKILKELDYYEQTYQIKSGGTVLCNDSNEWIDYDLRTFDGGKMWYSVKYNDDTLRILGEVDTIQPGLFKCLEAWDKIKEHVIKNGPVTMDQINHNDSIIGTLKEAGITITKK